MVILLKRLKIVGVVGSNPAIFGDTPEDVAQLVEHQSGPSALRNFVKKLHIFGLLVFILLFGSNPTSIMAYLSTSFPE